MIVAPGSGCEDELNEHKWGSSPESNTMKLWQKRPKFCLDIGFKGLRQVERFEVFGLISTSN